MIPPDTCSLNIWSGNLAHDEVLPPGEASQHTDFSSTVALLHPSAGGRVDGVLQCSKVVRSLICP